MNFVDAFFSVLNFGVLVAFLVYIGKKYIAPRIRENMVKDYHDLEHLHEELQELTDDQNHLEESIVAQEDYAKLLFKKINHWRNSVDLQREHDLEQKKLLREHMQVRAREQERQFQLHKTYDAVAPLVAQKLRKDLHETYKDQQKGHAYIDSLLATLRKS